MSSGSGCAGGGYLSITCFRDWPSGMVDAYLSNMYMIAQTTATLGRPRMQLRHYYAPSRMNLWRSASRVIFSPWS